MLKKKRLKLFHANLSKSAQSSIEFVILVGAVLFFFTVFFLLIQENMLDKINERKNILLKETALTVQNEINLALGSNDGYLRFFKIEDKIGNQDYEIEIVNDMVYLKTSDNKNAIALPVAKINGQVQKGTNKIEKKEGEIFLNS